MEPGVGVGEQGRRVSGDRPQSSIEPSLTRTAAFDGGWLLSSSQGVWVPIHHGTCWVHRWELSRHLLLHPRPSPPHPLLPVPSLPLSSVQISPLASRPLRSSNGFPCPRNPQPPLSCYFWVTWRQGQRFLICVLPKGPPVSPAVGETDV